MRGDASFPNEKPNSTYKYHNDEIEESFDMLDKDDKEKKRLDETYLTDKEAALMVMSTTVGLGLIFMPANYYNLGIPIAIILTILLGAQNYYSSHLYFQTLKNLPKGVE